MSRQWESKKASGKVINVKFEKADDAVEGYLMETLTEQGSEGKSSIHILKTEKDEEKVFWGSMVIDDQLAKVDFGNYVMVKFLGKVKSKTGGREYKNFEVFEDTTAEGIEVEAPVKEETVPANAVDDSGSDDDEDTDPF